MINCPVFIITNIVGFNQITKSFKYLCCNEDDLMNYNHFVVTTQSECSNYRYRRARLDYYLLRTTSACLNFVETQVCGLAFRYFLISDQ